MEFAPFGSADKKLLDPIFLPVDLRCTDVDQLALARLFGENAKMEVLSVDHYKDIVSGQDRTVTIAKIISDSDSRVDGYTKTKTKMDTGDFTLVDDENVKHKADVPRYNEMKLEKLSAGKYEDNLSTRKLDRNVI